MSDGTSYKQPRTGGHQDVLLTAKGNTWFDFRGGGVWDSLKFHSPWKEDFYADDPEAIANGERLGACWNACTGIPTEQLEAAPPGSVKALVEVAQAARDVFEFYAKEHARKAKEAADSYERMGRNEKAGRNQGMADRLNAALSHFTGGSNNGE